MVNTMQEANIIIYNKVTHEKVDEFIASFDEFNQLKERIEDELHNYGYYNYNELDWLHY